MTYSKPPTKTILFDVMSKLTSSIKEKSMPFAVIVGDHPVYAVILELKGENPLLFQHIIPFMGPFHIHMSYMSTIYKRFKGSGLSDVLVAAGVIAGGSVDQALKGKHYKRGVRCLKLFYEALIHLALCKQLEDSPLSGEVKESLAELHHQMNHNTYKKLEMNAEIKDLVNSLFTGMEQSPKAQYWLSFLEMVEVLTQNIYAIRTQKWEDFKASLWMLLPWLQIYDNDRYGRHLPDFCAMLDNLPADQETYFANGMFAQSMTGKPYSCLALDIWIETTMNKGSKLKSGWLAILRNEKQLLSHTRNTNNVNCLRAKIHNDANMKQKDNTPHADCMPRQLELDEQAVQDILECITEFDGNPFDDKDQILRSLQSGLPASTSLAEDFRTAKADGAMKLETFLNERVYSKAIPFYGLVKRSKRKNFETQIVETTGGESATKKVEDMERQALACVVNLAEESGGVHLEDILQYRVTEECLSLFNSNGTMRKTQKSKLLRTMSLVPVPAPRIYIAIVDMGLLWRLAIPSIEDREKPDGSIYTWFDYGEKMLSLLMARHRKACQIICVNDQYTQHCSIKDSERIRRQKCPVGNVYMRKDDKFPSSREFLTILEKPENKTRLQVFLQSVFTEVNTPTEIVYIVVGGRANNLTMGEDMPQFAFSHAEADTALFTTYSEVRFTNNAIPVVLDTEDTDAYVQAAYVAKQIEGPLYIRRKKEIISASGLCDESMVECFIPLHVISGSDHNSCFYGIGKKSIAGRVESSAEAKRLLSQCGAELPAAQSTLQDMEKFVIKYVYNDKKSKTMTEARVSKWRVQKIKSIMRLPPDTSSLRLHLQRANYLAYIQKQFMLKTHPSPLGHGWSVVNGFCMPEKSSAPALPSSISVPVNIQSDEGSADELTNDNYSSESESEY